MHYRRGCLLKDGSSLHQMMKMKKKMDNFFYVSSSKRDRFWRGWPKILLRMNPLFLLYRNHSFWLIFERENFWGKEEEEGWDRERNGCIITTWEELWRERGRNVSEDVKEAGNGIPILLSTSFPADLSWDFSMDSSGCHSPNNGKEEKLSQIMKCSFANNVSKALNFGWVVTLRQLNDRHYFVLLDETLAIFSDQGRKLPLMIHRRHRLNNDVEECIFAS